MANPRDAAPRYGVPVNPFSGLELTERQQADLARIREAAGILDQVLCDMGGTQVGSPKGARNLAVAATKLDEAVMWAAKEVLGQ